MKKLQCWLIENDCYKKFQGVIMEPTGITVHSTDKAGKVLKRFVQPAAGQTVGLSDDGKTVTANRMLEILGKNIYGNSWNRSGVDACVHAFIGQVAAAMTGGLFKTASGWPAACCTSILR